MVWTGSRSASDAPQVFDMSDVQHINGREEAYGSSKYIVDLVNVREPAPSVAPVCCVWVLCVLVCVCVWGGGVVCLCCAIVYHPRSVPTRSLPPIIVVSLFTMQAGLNDLFARANATDVSSFVACPGAFSSGAAPPVFRALAPLLKVLR